LRKFNSKSKKNKLYFAFRELGRAIRTTYLLHYVDDSTTKKMVNAGTCKSEEFNNFLDWVSFGNNKIIRDNRKNSQRKINQLPRSRATGYEEEFFILNEAKLRGIKPLEIKRGHLVANMVMTHVVVNMTKAINQLRSEGHQIDENLLKDFSPYRMSHMNRLGVFIVDKSRQAEEPVFNLVK